MKKFFSLILFLFGLLSASACTPTCSEELTPAQCANEGTHEYIRTYDFVAGCGKGPGLVAGISEITWAFSPQGDTIMFAGLFPNNAPAPENLISIEPNVYRPALATSLPSNVRLDETGFKWLFFDADSNDICYQVIYTLPEN